MCGIAGLIGRGWQQEQLETMVAYQRDHGPDLPSFVGHSSDTTR